MNLNGSNWFDVDRDQVVQAVFSATKDELSEERIKEIADCLPGNGPGRKLN